MIPSKQVSYMTIDLFNAQSPKKSYMMSSDAFRSLSERTNLRGAFVREVKKHLEKEGFTLLDMHKNFDLIAIFRFSTLERKLTILDEDDLDYLI